MKINAFIQSNPTPNQKPVANKPDQAPQAPKEEFTPSSPSPDNSASKGFGPVILGAAVGAGVGLFAGAGGGGILGGVAGTLAGTGLGVAATVGAARVGLDEQSFGIGMAGVAIGGVAGCVLGAMGHSWASGAALAAGGALTGALVGISSLLK